MASISTAPSCADAAPGGATPGCTPTSAPGFTGSVADTSTPGISAETTDGFIELFAEMINAGTAPSQPAGPLSAQELAALGLGSAQPEAPADKSDSDSDDTENDEAGALAMATLLPGMSCPAPGTANTAATASGMSQQSAAAATAITTARVAVDVSQAAVDDLTDDTADAAGNAPAPTADSTSSNSTQGATNAAQFHALLSTHTAADIDTVPDATLRAPVGTHVWKEELGAQLTWMASNGREAASLRLSPEHLGPLEIRISVQDGAASVYFGATNADTRSALEQSLPRLRELFASQGLVLADACVSRDSPRNQFKPATFTSDPRRSSDAGVEHSVTAVTLARAGLIDTYV